MEASLPEFLPKASTVGPEGNQGALISPRNLRLGAWDGWCWLQRRALVTAGKASANQLELRDRSRAHTFPPSPPTPFPATPPETWRRLQQTWGSNFSGETRWQRERELG